MKHLQLIGALFTLLLGTLLHFTYEWSGKSGLVGIFSAVNESTWEHLKLLAIPMLLFGIAEYSVYGKQIANFIPVKALSIFIGMITIIALFYSYVGVVGQHFLLADIGTFVVGTILAYVFSAHFLNTDFFSSPLSIFLGWLCLAAIITSFALFTPYPPHIGLFLDPVFQRYGK